MRKLIMLSFCLSLIYCDDKKQNEQNNQTNQTNNSPKSSKIMYGKKFFNYDQVDYYFTDIEEDKVNEFYDNLEKSKIDKMKFDVILGDSPENIEDIDFLESMKTIGYSKKEISSKDFAELDKIFVEKTATESTTAACIAIFRDVLVFKNKGKVIGVVKVCFSCHQYEITGNVGSDENFGSDSDYESLGRLLDTYD